jgi:putative oxidoreductase
MVDYIAHPAQRGSHSVAGHFFDRFVAVCGLVPYSVVAVVLRLVVARAFLALGQTMITGPSIPVSFQNVILSITLPVAVRDEIIRAYETQFASWPVWPWLLAQIVAYALFVLPICLVVGFGTRVAALLLLVLTIMFQCYVSPDALWTTHVYWGSILLVLMTCGAGVFSLDRLIRHIYQK